MSTAIKIVLAIVSAGILAVATIVGIGVYWWSRHGQDYISSVQESANDGMQAGRTMDSQQCVAEAVKRHRRDPGFGSAVKTRLFLTGCLKTAEPVDGFCDEVPRTTEFRESIGWQLAQCHGHELNDTYCGQLFSEVQKYCDANQLGLRRGGTGVQGVE
jgi:hypothetical protein